MNDEEKLALLKGFRDGWVIGVVLLAVVAISIYAATLPIDEGQELSRLATAGIMRCANV